MIYHVLVFAFLIVIASTALMTPILLYAFDLRNAGWMWQHAALFSAMIAPTDAVSVSSILKKGMPTPNAASKQTNTQGPALGQCVHPRAWCLWFRSTWGSCWGRCIPVCNDKWVCVVYLQTAAFANSLHKTKGHHCVLSGTRCNSAMPPSVCLHLSISSTREPVHTPKVAAVIVTQNAFKSTGLHTHQPY